LISRFVEYHLIRIRNIDKQLQITFQRIINTLNEQIRKLVGGLMNQTKVHQVVFQGNTYYWINNSWWDQNNLAVPQTIVQHLNLIKPGIRIIHNINDLSKNERQKRKDIINAFRKGRNTDTKRTNDIFDQAIRLPGDRYRK
jgi:hypothetical protein